MAADMNRDPLLICLMVLGGLVLFFGGFILLVPGLCRLVPILGGNLGGPVATMIFFFCVGISALGFWLIVKTFP
jgi:hypothetical protein